MGVFTNSGSNLDLDMTGIIECAYEPGLEGALAIVAESEENYNRLMQATGLDELKFLEENGYEMVYTESTGSGFFESAKKFFENIWQKIKGLFTKFFAMFDSFIKSDKEFISKYQKKLVQVDSKDLTYNGFEYTFPIDATAAASKVDSIDTDRDLVGAITKYKDETEVVEKWRGNIIGGGTLTASEFAKELYEKFRNGESTKQELDHLSATKYIGILQGSAKKKKDAEKDFNTIRKEIDKAIKAVNALSKEALSDLKGSEAEENGKKARGAAIIIKMMKNAISLIQVVNGAHLTAIKDENRQARAILVKMLGYKPKNESFDYEGGYGESNLSRINFV